MRKFLYFIFSGVLISSTCFSQIYNFRTYAEDEGLPHSYIYHISQEANGSLSLSTGEGLSIFDGTNFTTFTNKEIAENFVTTHFIDSRNIAFFGHVQNGISYLKNGKFNHIKNAAINNYKVTQFAEDSKKDVWVATTGGLFTIDTAFQLKPRALKNISTINGFVFDDYGKLLLATPNGLSIVDKSSLKVECTDLLHGKNLKQIIHDNKKGIYWLIAEGDGVYGIKYDGKKYIQFAHFLSEFSSQTNNITAIYSDRLGNLWVALFGEGLKKITFSGTGSDRFSIATINKANGLNNAYIQFIFQDFEGNMWFGTFGAGLIEKPIEKFSYYSEGDGLNKTDIKKIAIDKNGQIWLATETGLANFSPSGKALKFYDGSNGFVNDKVNTVFVDENGLIWIGTNTNGIYTLNASSMKFENLNNTHHLPKFMVNSILEDRSNNIIAGTNDGIFIFDQLTDSVKILTTFDGLLHNNVLNLFNDSKDRLWISSHGSPPYYIKDWKFTVFKDIPELKTFNINSICEDRNGLIWVATEGDGVFKYNGRTFFNYKMIDGLLSNFCYGIVCDNYNSIWVTHKTGLSEKKSSIKEFHSISTNEGLLFMENNVNSFYKDSIGDIWFGTTKGLVQFNSEVMKENNAEPKLSITKIKMNNISYNPVNILKKEYGFYSLHIDFLAISLTDPLKIKYKYRLLGIDSIWKTTTSAFVDYSNLSDGNFVFQVMACNSEGMWTSVPAEITIVIKEPIWKKFWFYPGLIILIAVLTYLFVYWRTMSLKKGQALLQKNVREKTMLLQKEKEEVEKVKGELEQKNKDITDSINYARRIQDSLLPPEEFLNDLFVNNYFIFHNPKDIVSGDFYWAAQTVTSNTNSRLALAAVADCTGHGVPGAFLSIVASNLLKQSLTEQSVNTPAEALEFLNVNITSNLNRSTKGQMRDGMDIAFVAINYNSKKLYYSGANNPVYIIRKCEKGSEINILEPTKKAIGSGISDDIKYALHSFDLLKDDVVYLFSDGYPDQFGGDRDKKLNYKRFKGILQEAFKLPIHQQKEYVEKVFFNWKGDTEQTDDVCVMGIKID